jgi:hypothetical protein
MFSFCNRAHTWTEAHLFLQLSMYVLHFGELLVSNYQSHGNHITKLNSSGI